MTTTIGWGDLPAQTHTERCYFFFAEFFTVTATFFQPAGRGRAVRVQGGGGVGGHNCLFDPVRLQPAQYLKDTVIHGCSYFDIFSCILVTFDEKRTFQGRFLFCFEFWRQNNFPPRGYVGRQTIMSLSCNLESVRAERAEVTLWGLCLGYYTTIIGRFLWLVRFRGGAPPLALPP